MTAFTLDAIIIEWMDKVKLLLHLHILLMIRSKQVLFRLSRNYTDESVFEQSAWNLINLSDVSSRVQ